MKWLVIQLSPWAEKHLSFGKIEAELKRHTQLKDLNVYYPVIEDVVGKHNTPFSEYFFVEYREGMSLSGLEGNEVFRVLLRDSRGEPQTVDKEDLEKIQEHLKEQESLKEGDVVRIHKGALRGNDGVVKFEDEEDVCLGVLLGDQAIEAVVPKNWLRKKGIKGKRGKRRRRKH